MTATCEHVKPNGKRCGQTVGLLPGVDGRLLCAWDDPARASNRRAKQAPDPAGGAPAAPAALTLADLPVQEVTCLEDAEKLARWAMIAVVLGALAPRQAQACVAVVKEYRMTLGDADTINKSKALLARMTKDAAEFADLRRRVAAAKDRGLDV